MIATDHRGHTQIVLFLPIAEIKYIKSVFNIDSLFSHAEVRFELS